MRKKNKSQSKDVKITEEIKELVIMRIETTPSNLRLSIGGSKGMTKEELIEHVKKEDTIGKQIIRTHIAFLKAVATGTLTEALASI